MAETKQLGVGDKLPEHSFQVLKEDAEGKQSVAQVSVADLFSGKKVVLFALPGAYTPTCSARHLPGYVDDVEKFRAKGVDTIVCLSVNDAFVMYHWGKEHKADGKVVLVADGDAAFSNKIGLSSDTGAFGGIRSQRYALVADDGVVTHLAVEEPHKFEVSSSDSILEHL
eukprot:CAMPEP_0177628280 /NCGR_PEP_ID=MMETSP0447-20121125/47_1 /TAXON_ID=0 /ORGANISM="Stygamoeba regulata, Strain BSH-02190019" /LENGTH=168 /DNA_ID=CAMNT_0019129517 /DNA_START=60 /DNA_END=566 /DNA_ORIENTATION=+